MNSTADWLFLTIAVAIPLGSGILGTTIVFIVARGWRSMHHPGKCYVCGYDLRGNVSHRCPECGLQLGGDEDNLWAYVRTFPEALLFETAADRDAAMQEMPRRIRRISIFWGSVFVAAMVGINVTMGAWMVPRYRTNAMVPDVRFLAAMSLNVFVVALFSCINIRLKHQALRRILRERGIRVCLHCGQDLREVSGDACPGCHRPSVSASRSSQWPPPPPPD